MRIHDRNLEHKNTNNFRYIIIIFIHNMQKVLIYYLIIRWRTYFHTKMIFQRKGNFLVTLKPRDIACEQTKVWSIQHNIVYTYSTRKCIIQNSIIIPSTVCNYYYYYVYTNGREPRTHRSQFALQRFSLMFFIIIGDKTVIYFHIYIPTYHVYINMIL